MRPRSSTRTHPSGRKRGRPPLGALCRVLAARRGPCHRRTGIQPTEPDAGGVRDPLCRGTAPRQLGNGSLVPPPPKPSWFKTVWATNWTIQDQPRLPTQTEGIPGPQHFVLVIRPVPCTGASWCATCRPFSASFLVSSDCQMIREGGLGHRPTPSLSGRVLKLFSRVSSRPPPALHPGCWEQVTPSASPDSCLLRWCGRLGVLRCHSEGQQAGRQVEW